MRFKPREVEDIRRLIESAVRIENHHPAFTGFVEGRIIGCGGIVILWPGVAEAWLVLTDEITQYSLWFHRTVKMIMDDFIRAFKLRRIQATVRADSERNKRWIKMLGFSEEGLLRRFGPDGMDYYIFAFVMEG